ncbi:MAG TPA: hypothetical protein VGD01_07245 [Candidatus Elarobacter sp.]
MNVIPSVIRAARLVRVALVTGLIAAAAAPALAADAVPDGSIVLAKPRGDAVIVWDATDALAALVAKKSSAAATLRALEADATLIVRDRAPKLKDQATSLTVNVIYTRTGAVSPVYQVATIAGYERLLTVKAPIQAALAARGWDQEIRNGKPPHELEIAIVGKLPPEMK